jgi:hypothetical protein
MLLSSSLERAESSFAQQRAVLEGAETGLVLLSSSSQRRAVLEAFVSEPGLSGTQ